MFNELKWKILCVIFAGILVLFSIVIVTAEDEDTVISVGSPNQLVSAGDTFSIDVICNPSQPIKAFEFRLSFDPSLLQANSVTEGGFFQNYTTFFNAGNIDNAVGSIADVYGLIIGPGNVSDSGSLITISFTAKQNSGTSSFSLNGVGVTDESGYISVGVNEGSVTVQGGSSGGGGYFTPGDDDENNSPEEPVKPSGPTLIEVGVEYVFETWSFDADGDSIRFMFDWGDGNYSDWSEFVDSNVSVSMSYFWTYTSSFKVKAIAQDENGLNSSWSLPLNVNVSQVVFGIGLPVADFNFSGNFTENDTIMFDASGSFDVDGFIVSYYWDFGDGEYGSGITLYHIYSSSGDYNVTLVVTDNNGNTCIKSVTITVASSVEEELDGIPGVFSFDLGFIFFGVVILALIGLGVFYRDSIKSFLSSYQFDLHLGIFSLRDRIRSIDAKISVLKMDIETKTDFRQPFVVRQSVYSDEVQRSHDEISRFIDSEVTFASDVEVVSEFDGFHSGEKVDDLIGMALKSKGDIDIGSFQGLDINSTIDDLLISKNWSNINRFDVGRGLFYRIGGDSFERKIDGIIDSRIRVKINSLFEDS